MATENKQFAVIGLGRFGMAICRELSAQNAQVLAIDINEDLVNQAADIVSQSVVADCSNVGVINELQLKNYDLVVVAIGDDVNANILTTLLLKEAGVKSVWVKAKDRNHSKILSKVGANKIIMPETDMGSRIARSIQNTKIADYMLLGSGLTLVEIIISASYIGHRWEDHPCFKDNNVTFLCLKRESKIIQEIPEENSFEVGDVILIVTQQDYLPIILNKL